MPLSEAAKTITRHRERLHWSKRRLAREAGVSAGYIVQLEKGDRPVTAHTLARIADAVGLHPYVLLGEAGFIPAEHVDEAERMAALAMEDPEMERSAMPGDTGGKLAWIVADYLNMLGDNAYAARTDGPFLVGLDWSKLAPERWDALMAGSPNARTTQAVAQELQDWMAGQTAPPTQIEGWDELTDAQRKLVQQLVNQFRRAPAAEEANDGNAEA